jgi:hypothetical protein
MSDDDLKGVTVYDSHGDTVGKIDRTYGDEGGRPEYGRVKIGTFMAKYRLVPLDGAEATDDGLKVPYTKEYIENSLDLPEDVDPRAGMVAEDLRGYYAAPSTAGRATETTDDVASRPLDAELSPARTDTATGQETPTASSIDAGELGAVRDYGDVVEIPVVEERLVKQPVVTEVLRVRKTTSGDEQIVSADLRKEDVDVESEGDVLRHEGSDES